MIIYFLIMSFLLDGIMFSLLQPAVSLFCLMSLIIIYPYHKTSKEIYIYALILGILYDIAYTNSLFLNTLLFVGSVYLINKIFKTFTSNLLNTFIVSTLFIILYRLTVFGIYLVLNIAGWNFQNIIKSFANSLIINYIFIIISYGILSFISHKFMKKRKIN